MGKKELLDRIAESLAEVIDEDLQDDESRLKEAVRENLDWDELAKEAVADPQTKEAIKAEVRKQVVDKIKSADSLEELFDDGDFNLFDTMFGEEGLTGLVRDDKDLREAVENRIRQLAKKEIKDIESLNDFATDNDTDSNGDIDWSKFVFGDEDGLKEFIEKDESLLSQLQEKFKKLVLDAIKDLDDDDLPDRSDIIEALNLADLIPSLLKDEAALAEIKTIFKDELISDLKDHIDLSDNLPEDFSEIFVAPLIKQILESPGDSREFQEQLKETLSQNLISHLMENRELLVTAVGENQNIRNLINRTVDSIFTDSKLIDDLKNNLTRRIRDEGRLTDRLFSEVLTAFVGRLLDKLSK